MSTVPGGIGRLLATGVFFCALAATAAPPAAQSASSSLARECPSLEQWLCNAVSRAGDLPSSSALRAIPATVPLLASLLNDSSRADDAVVVFERLLSQNLTTVLDALEMFADRGITATLDRTRDQRPRVIAGVAGLSDRVRSLPREDAARLAWAIKRIELQFGEPRTSDWAPAQQEFVAAYSGTEAARLVEVDLIERPGRAPMIKIIEDLERYSREHPRSIDGAKALYLAGFHLAHNLMSSAQLPRDADPTEYVLRVMKIANDLEHGDHPASKWVREAPSLVPGFYIRSDPPVPAFAPGNLERLIAAYQAFVNSHFDPNGTENPLGSNIGYVVTSRMAQLYRWMGVPDGVERTLAALAESGADRQAVALFRAEYVMLKPEGRAQLEALAAAPDGYPARKALADLIALADYDGDDSAAVSAAERYVAKYSSSPFAWIASFRLAQARERAGDTNAALAEYERALTLSTVRTAQVVVAVAEARTREKRNEFALALAAYARARDRWPQGIGQMDIGFRRRSNATEPGAERASIAVTRDEVMERIASLEKFAEVPGGEILLRAQRQIAARDFPGAQKLAQEFLRTHANAPGSPAARQLLHNAQLEVALAIGTKDAADPAFAAALAAVDGETLDGQAAVARIARALILQRDGDADAAATLAEATLSAWRAASSLAQSTDSALDRDLSDILEASVKVVFDRSMHDSYGAPPQARPPGARLFLRDSIKLRLPGSDAATPHRLALLPQNWTNAILMSEQDLAMMSRAGGLISGRKPAESLLSFWNRYFPSPQRGWGWMMQTFPNVVEVEFLDAAHSKAAARVSRDSGSGFTAVLEKQGGSWVVVRITNQWIA